MRTRTVALRLLVASVATVVMFTVIPAGVASAAGSGTVTITGRGWGHGRGMGQYGALGLAQDHGWNSAQILDHFYGGTVAGKIPANAVVNPDAVRVDLRYLHGNATHIGLEAGTMVLTRPDLTEIGRFQGSVRVASFESGYKIATAPSCAGPWTDVTEAVGVSHVNIVPIDQPADRTGLLHVCLASGGRTWYSGHVQATVDPSGNRRTVNVTTIEEYLRGVVPNESPSKWPLPALEAQAVAARSYAMAGDTRQLPYADTCETTRCQVYWGRFHQKAGGSILPMTNTRTDAAIAATTGLVRINAVGGIARTEFSSSTGGHTAGGTFPAVPDIGDAVADNPNKEWTVDVDVSRVERKFGKGQLVSIVPTSRNGLGPDGGRVLTVDFNFTGGTVTQKGWVARTTLGLKSDWFVPGEIARPVAAGTYTVQPGDTISKIARALGVSWQELAAINGIGAPYIIKVGQVLKVPGVAAPAPVPAPAPAPAPAPTPAPTPPPPAALTYTVKRGDTISKIARAHGVKWLDLAAANGIVSPWRINVGQVLTIPGATAQVTAAPAPVGKAAPVVVTTYTVQPGDSLSKIGAKVGVPWRTIAAKNKITAPYRIRVGQKLAI